LPEPETPITTIGDVIAHLPIRCTHLWLASHSVQ
ncbi:MAG: hypothetical protein QOH82_1705, partial [Mycobacterium sp.]|nr:hypothetical protein [Mycobacterium sp.]